MRRFAELYDAIDRTTSTNAKVDAMALYFREAPREDAAWALYFLMGRRLRKVTGSGELSATAMSLSGLPEWLLHECYSAVGDGAETIALVLETAGVLADVNDRRSEEAPLHEWVEGRFERLKLADAAERKRLLGEWWLASDAPQVFLLVKMLTGALRVGVSATLVTRAVAHAAGLPSDVIADRLMGEWRPGAAFMERLLSQEVQGERVSRPYPFYLATPLDPPRSGVDEAAAIGEVLGPIERYQVEWKWDGIRSQLIRRDGQTSIWSRGEELLTERFPEILESAARLPGSCVLDGEILAYKGGKPLPFAKLQKRIGRQHITARALAEAPAAFMAYDVLEVNGADIRSRPLAERRRVLEEIIGPSSAPRMHVSEVVTAGSWAALAELRGTSRSRGVEGLMLKAVASPYGVGRERGAWWKWKIDPHAIDAVLIYAQPGHGKRASLLTDYTFGVWDGAELVAVAKAYSGLSNEEIVRLDGWIRQHTTGRFGPVRIVEPVHVFELHFEGIQRSPRHRSGIAVRFPRISRWRTDKLAGEADTLRSVQRLLVATGGVHEPTIFDVEGMKGEDGAG